VRSKATAAATALLLLLLGFAAAQELWTVQTVAFPDYRQAQAAEAELKRLGFDAYTEFTMHEGKQYTRVRVGCYTARESAEWLAELLVAGFVAEAAVLPYTDEAEAAFCVRDEVGFIKPRDWDIQVQDALQIVFRVRVGGHTGYVRLRDGQWRLLTAIEPATSPAAVPAVRFEQLSLAGQQVVRARTPSGDRVVCPGRLIWQSGLSVVTDRGSSVSACVLQPGPGWNG